MGLESKTKYHPVLDEAQVLGGILDGARSYSTFLGNQCFKHGRDQ